MEQFGTFGTGKIDLEGVCELALAKESEE